MNRWVRRQPIRRKVALLIGAALLLALLLAGSAVVLYEFTTYRPRALRDAETQAELIRVNSVAALQFSDQEAMSENLATLRSRPEILSAALFDAEGADPGSLRPGGSSFPAVDCSLPGPPSSPAG